MSDTTMKEAAPRGVAQRPDFEFRDPARLTKVVSILLIVSAVASTFLAISNSIKCALLGSHAGYDLDLWIAIDALLILFQVSFLFITAFAFLMWIYRANWNAHALGAAGMRFRPGWAVGWFFVPIASLWVPYQVMREIWRVSANPGDWENAPGTPLLGWWWALYLIKSFTAGLAYKGASTEGIVTMGQAGIAVPANLLSVAASLVAWQLLRKVAANQVFQANIAQVF